MPLFKAFAAPNAEVTFTPSKSEYALGSTIDGTITFSSQEDLECQEVVLEIVGVERIKGRLLDLGGSISTRIYSPVGPREVRPDLPQTELLMLKKTARVAGPTRIKAGSKTNFPVSVQLPNNAGPSYQGAREDGSWMERSWIAKAVIAVAGRPDIGTAARINVVLPAPPAKAAIPAGTPGGAAEGSATGAELGATSVAKTLGTDAPLPTECPKCGAPIRITQEDIFYTCKYCGNSIPLSTRDRIKKHSMLVNRLFTQQVVDVARKYMDKGILRIGVAKDAVITEVKLRYLPFWVFPVDATTSFRGTVGGSGAPPIVGRGSNSKAELAGKLIVLGADMYMRSQGRDFRAGDRGRYVPPRTVAQTFSNHYIWPILARGAMISEVKFYDVPVDQKIPFDVGKVPSEADFLNSEYSEDDAKSRVRAEVEAKERQIATSRVQVLETVTSNITIGEGELIHAPVWFVYYMLKGESYVIAVDGSMGKVLGGGRPLIKLR